MSRDLHPDPDAGAALRWLRQQAGLQQQELAAVLERTGRGVSTVWLSQVENGRRQPSWQLVHRLLTALDADLTVLQEVLDSRPWAPKAVTGEPLLAGLPVARGGGAAVPPALPSPDLAAELGELIAAYLALPPAERDDLRTGLRGRTAGGPAPATG